MVVIINNKEDKIIYSKLVSHLKAYKKATITLGELERLFTGKVEYNVFAENVLELISENILVGKSSFGNNGKELPLPYKFGVNKYELRKEHIERIEKYNLKLNKAIDLHEYFNLSEEILERDLPYINKINEYLEKSGLPKDYVTPQERSFYIVGDEKWIDEKGGKKLLGRIKLWDNLNIVASSDPLMLAVNPKEFSKEEHFHLIVENKATFLALLEVLPMTKFTSLIFGSGWKIVSNINMLEAQIGINGKHKLYYFGDLDNEGISIWNSLNGRVTACPAIEFYKELLKKPYSLGKASQLENKEAINNFTEFFSEAEKLKIKSMLEDGGYLPQEGLAKDELSSIWRGISWT